MASVSPAPPSLHPKIPLFSPVKPEIQPPATAAPSPRPPQPPPPSSEPDVVHIPSYSRWFSWDNIHECEVRFLPEFFDSRSPSKNPSVYKYYRNSIISQFRKNPSAKLTFTEIRKTLVGDVGSIRRVFDFLDAWGLINYSPLNKQLKWEDGKDSSSKTAASPAGGGGGDGGTAGDANASNNKDNCKRLCSGCKSLCSIACFFCDKYDITLCARCYVRGNYRVGVSSSDFRRVEISEEARTDWTEKETLQLLEAVMHYRDDWKKVAQHVGGRSEKDCITHFIKLPFGEVFTDYTDVGDVDSKYNQIKECDDDESGPNGNGSPSPSKKIRLSPLVDASNPIMAQAAFLSALAGTEVAEAAARAAVTTLTEVEYGGSKGSLEFVSRVTKHLDSGVASNGDTNLNASVKACLDANSLLEKEESDVETAISRITEVQMKEIQDKILRFEELDLQMEKEWQQLDQMKNLLFADQLSVLSKRSLTTKIDERGSTLKAEERGDENAKTD
uniref:SWI/SNF complex subunit SWI3B n=1 Tax=Populus davidiana TaxID=266767 RepID=A0A6M2F0F4_9ROSI